MRGSKSSAPLRRSSLAGVAVTLAALLSVIGIGAAWWCFARGYTLYFGDAEAHLNIARRILDSRTPGPDQIGTVWLPLPHFLLIPFVTRDAWWHSGLAGVFPSVACFVIAGMFLFLSWSCFSLPATFSLVAAALDASRHSMGIGVQPPRFRWVPYVDALLFPLDNSALAAATPDRAQFFPLEDKLRAQYLQHRRSRKRLRLQKQSGHSLRAMRARR